MFIKFMNLSLLNSLGSTQINIMQILPSPDNSAQICFTQPGAFIKNQVSY